MGKKLLKTLTLWMAALLLLPSASVAAVSMGTITLKVGEEYHADARYSSTTTNQQGTWSKSNSNIVITARGNASCTIRGNKVGTARLSYSGTAAPPNSWSTFDIDCYWTINVVADEDEVKISNLSISSASASLRVGETLQLTKTITPSNATDKSVSWTSGNSNVATVSSSGLVTAKGVGSTVITCKANDGSGKTATCSVSVAEGIKATGIAISPSSIALKVGGTKQLSVAVSPSNATDKSVSWSSTNSGVASVSSSGLVTAKSLGKASIIVRTNDGSGVADTCSVIVSTHSNFDTFTAKTKEGVSMRFRVGDVSSGECYVLGYSHDPAIDVNTTGAITIPEEVEGFKVTSISSSAFQYCNGITKVAIPSSVKSIGVNAFFCCYALSTITGISQLEHIGGTAFLLTPWYNSLPDGLVYIGKVLYEYKGTMPAGTEITVKDGTVSISEGAFNGCSGLVGVVIPQSVTEIYGESFSQCRNLSSITVASGNAKYDSRGNSNAVIDKETNVLVVGCKGTTFPGTVRAIGSYAFYGSGIQEVAITSNIERIADHAFWGCKSLESVGIGSGVHTIGRDAFEGCDGLCSISVVSGNPYYDSRDNCNAIIEKSSNKLVAGCSATVIPQSVKSIGEYAFSGVFSGVYNFTIPDQVESIGYGAFGVGSNIFGSNSCLRSITIGKNVKEYGRRAFMGCYGLKTVHSLCAEPVEINEDVFSSSVYENATLYVPVGSRLNYMCTEGWAKFKNIVETDQATGLAGDVNGDGVVDGIDVVALSNLVLANSTENSVADVNGDGVVDGVDIVALANTVLGGGNNAKTKKLKAVAAAATGISFEPFTIAAGGEKEVVLDMTNPSDSITLVQFDMVLPEGLSLKQSGGDYDIDIAGRTTWRRHTLNARDNGGFIRFLMYSATNALIEGSEGALIKMTLVADESFKGGDIRLENILLVTPKEKGIRPDAYVYSLAAPEEPAETGISVEPFTIEAGEEKEVTIDMTNPDDNITLVQFDMVLPEGLSLKQSGGDYDIDIAGRTTWRKHTLNARDNGGFIRFLMYSATNALIEGSEGALIKMTLVADESFKGGKIGFENILLVTPEEKGIRPASFEVDAVSKSVGIDETTMGGKPAQRIYDLSGRRLSKPQKGINIIDGKKVLIK